MSHVSVAGLKLAYRILKLTDTLSCSLQSVAMNGADGMQVVMAAVKYLIDWRTEKELDNYFQETLEDSEKIGRCLAEVAMKPFFTYRSSYNDVKLQPSFSDLCLLLIFSTRYNWYILVLIDILKLRVHFYLTKSLQ